MSIGVHSLSILVGVYYSVVYPAPVTGTQALGSTPGSSRPDVITT